MRLTSLNYCLPPRLDRQLGYHAANYIRFLSLFIQRHDLVVVSFLFAERQVVFSSPWFTRMLDVTFVMIIYDIPRLCDTCHNHYNICKCLLIK
jgi:hypothetical protein